MIAIRHAPDHVARQRGKRSGWALAALVAGVAAVGLRLWLIALGLPRFDSDEGTMGLMALHILHHGELPVFFYGQAYMGALEAYLAVPFFALFGSSDFTLRVGLVLLFALFLTALYALMTLLYDRRVALLSTLMLALGSGEIIARELKAVGGYPEMLFFATAAFGVATYLAVSAGSTDRSSRRLLVYAAWGLAAGLGLWSSPLTLPFAITSAILLILTVRRELAGVAGLCLLAGLVVGLFPLLAYNLTAPAGGGTVGTVLRIAHSGGSGHVGRGADSLPIRIAGEVMVSIPVMTGGNGICRLQPQDAWPLSGHTSTHTVLCTAVHGTWGIAFLALWLWALSGAAAVVLSTIAGRRWGRPAMAKPEASPHDSVGVGAEPNWAGTEMGDGQGIAERCTPEPAELRVGRVEDTPGGDDRGSNERLGMEFHARAWARALLLVAAGLLMFIFLASPAPALAPWYNVRYLAGLWIVFPAICAPLVAAVSRHVSRPRAAASAGCLGLLALALLLDATHMFDDGGYTPWLYRGERALAADLRAHQVRHVWTDYWTCDWLAFETREGVTCAVLGPRLQTSLDRYRPYRVAVSRDPRAWYVYRLGTPQAAAMERRLGPPPSPWRRQSLSYYVVYVARRITR